MDWHRVGQFEVETPFGIMGKRIIDGDPVWSLRCPGCGTWGLLDDDQLHGRISVDHAADGCTGGYHETHNFAAELPAEERDLIDLNAGRGYPPQDRQLPSKEE